MARLIGDLLDMTSLRTNQFSLQRERQDLGAIVAESVDAHGSRARAKDQEIRVDLGADLEVDCDRDRVRQTLSNLLGNAIKFCGQGCRISVRAWRSDANVCVAVSDEGPGIPPADLDRIFEPYWTQGRASSGTGLGLYIARGIAVAHGGDLAVDSEVGRGPASP